MGSNYFLAKRYSLFAFDLGLVKSTMASPSLVSISAVHQPRFKQPCLSAFTIYSYIPNNRKCHFEIS